MWPFSTKRSLEEAGILRGWTDWHSHILPGVDDGIRTQEQSLKVLAFYAEAGVTDVWLTPHVMEDIPNTPAALKERFSVLKSAYAGPVRLHLAAEHMLDNLFQERFEAGELLPLGPEGKHLLVETSYFNPPMDLWDILERIRARGLQPVLAHPERYVYMEGKDYRRLKEMRVLFQLNLLSLAGLYGPGAARRAEILLEAGMYDLCGSDLHRLGAVREALAARVLKKKTVQALLQIPNTL